MAALSPDGFPGFFGCGDKRRAQVNGLGGNCLQALELVLIKAGGQDGEPAGTWLRCNTAGKGFFIEAKKAAFVLLKPCRKLLILY